MKNTAKESSIIEDVEDSIQETIPEEGEKENVEPMEISEEAPAPPPEEEPAETPAKKSKTTFAPSPDKKTTPRSTPCRVAGYMSFNVKDKAKAYEEHCRNSSTPKRLQSPAVASSHEIA